MTRANAVALLAIIMALAASGCGDDASRRSDARIYLSFGDSFAAGSGASDPATTSFAAILGRALGLETHNFAVAGATTSDVIEKQLPQAVAEAPPELVALITLIAGGNDLAALIPNTACVEDPVPPSCPLDETIGAIAERTDAIVRELRAAYPEPPIALLAYPNFFSGTGHAFEAPAGRVLPSLAAALRAVAARQERVIVVETGGFQGRGKELTHILDPTFDPHPNDGGHRVLAEAFIAALRH